MLTVGMDLLRAFCKLFYLQYLVSNNQWKNLVQQRLYVLFKRHFNMKTIVTLVPTDLVTNQILSFFVLSYKAKAKTISQEVGCLVTKKSVFCLNQIVLYFIGMSISIDFYKGIFQHVIPVLLQFYDKLRNIIEIQNIFQACPEA